MYIKLNKMIEDIYTLNGEEISQVVEAVKLRRNQLHTQDAQSYRVGDRVSFRGRYGRTETGTIEKVKIKYLTVRTDAGQRWSVPGSHLTRINKEVVNA